MAVEQNNYIDFHCHPALKPYGKSFNYQKKGWNNPHRSRRNSIWKYDPPSLGDKLLNYFLNLTKFSQSNFTSLAKGDVRIVCASLYPMEKGFFVNKIKSEFLRDFLGNLATGIGKKRIDAVQATTNYFKDLEMEYDFYKQLNNRIIRLPEGNYRYRLVKNYDEVLTILNEEEKGPKTIAVIFGIEGLHVLNSNLKKAPNEQDFLKNLDTIKQWETPPLIAGLAHHFWNHLCGHAASFTDLVADNIDQQEGMDTGITPLGKKVLHRMLDTSNGKRILVDIKHMSVTSREEYYALLASDAAYENVPLVVTHGAANGLISAQNPVPGGSKIAQTLNNADINFYNDELIRIAKSNGIFGLQLDERRVANKTTLKKTKNSVKRSKIMHYRSELLWGQIQHIVEVLDAEGMFAWNCIAIGSDFDGIIDPLNSFWTAEELPYLADFLERHAYNYMSNNQLNVVENNIDADEIVDRVMTKNGMGFLKATFK